MSEVIANSGHRIVKHTVRTCVDDVGRQMVEIVVYAMQVVIANAVVTAGDCFVYFYQFLVQINYGEPISDEVINAATYVIYKTDYQCPISLSSCASYVNKFSFVRSSVRIWSH